MQGYLSSNRKQAKKKKINSEFSSWEEILFRVTQGSILGPLLFNIFLCDFYFHNFASYAYDNTPLFVGSDLNEVDFKVQSAIKTFFNGLLTTK